MGTMSKITPLIRNALTIITIAESIRGVDRMHRDLR